METYKMLFERVKELSVLEVLRKAALKSCASELDVKLVMAYYDKAKTRIEKGDKDK